MRSSRFLLPLVFGILAIMFLMVLVCDHSLRKMERNVVSDTISVYDTVKVYVPVSKDSMVVRYVERYLPVVEEVQTKEHSEGVSIFDSVLPPLDSLNKPTYDSVKVKIPISQKIYSDSLYTAYISGYEANLDSIFFRRETMKIATTIQKKPPRFILGVQAGYGYTRKGFQPYIGIGVGLRILP